MKTLLLILLCQFGFGQCMEDSTRYRIFNYMEVFNHDTKQYEKYKKASTVSITIIVDVQENKLTFSDEGNKYYKEYKILDCQIGHTTIIYNCLDTKINKKCDFIFSQDKTLTVMYEPEPVIYRIKNQ